MFRQPLKCFEFFVELARFSATGANKQPLKQRKYDFYFNGPFEHIESVLSILEMDFHVMTSCDVT